jgi:hypothetical protein
MKCADANGCFAPSQTALAIFEGPQECIRDHCPDQAKACGADPGCLRALQDCERTCDKNQTCFTTCVAGKGNAPASALWKCIIDNKCLDQVTTAVALADRQQCIEDKCPTQWAACQKDPKCIPALQDCEKKCDTKVSCWTLCLGTKGSQAAIDVAKCAQANNCDKAVEVSLALATPQECIEKYCKNEQDACRHDHRCIFTLDHCHKECASNDSCWKHCLDNANNTNADKFMKCFVEHNCSSAVEKVQTAVALADRQQCIEDKCPTQWAACQKDPKCIPALQDCEKKCDTKVSCWTLCLGTKGSQAAIDVAKCAQANNCDKAVEVSLALATPQECIEKYCKNEEQACEHDRRCIATIDHCHRQCQNNDSCWKDCLREGKNINADKFMKCFVDHNCSSAVEKVQTQVAIFEGPQECIRDHCPDQAKACGADPGCLRALQDCERTCDKNQTCFTTCVAGKGNAPASALWKCIIDNKCLDQVETSVALVGDIKECAQEKCPNEWTKCTADKNCFPTIDHCEKKCGTKSSCWELCLGGAGDHPAIDLAKCAQKNGCLGSEKKEVSLSHPFLQCMEKSCTAAQLECLYDKHCSKTLRKCSNEHKKFDFDVECLHEHAKENALVSSWYSCAGDHFCL